MVRRVVAPRQPRGGQQIWREILGLEELRELQQLELELGLEVEVVRELELEPERERERELVREVEVREVEVPARPAVMAAGGRLCQVAQRLCASATDDNYFLTFSDRLMFIPPHDRKFVMYWCCIFVYFYFYLPFFF